MLFRESPRGPVDEVLRQIEGEQAYWRSEKEKAKKELQDGRMGGDKLRSQSAERRLENIERILAQVHNINEMLTQQKDNERFQKRSVKPFTELQKRVESDATSPEMKEQLARMNELLEYQDRSTKNLMNTISDHLEGLREATVAPKPAATAPVPVDEPAENSNKELTDRLRRSRRKLSS